ncbi:MAG: thiolase family protein [Thermodesulfobacteriota bacterium]|nr:thiolase family protein [Thermodesulfobacteriota bacterium]
MKEAVITTAVRTPAGRASGALKDIPVENLAAFVIKEVVDRSGINPEIIDEVYMGCRGQETISNLARYALLEAGLPTSIGAMTVQRTCASGLQTIISAAQSIQTGNGEVFIVGGAENMTRWAYIMLKPAEAYQRTFPVFTFAINSPPKFEGNNMGVTAENLQKKYDIKREEQDEFAYMSHMRAWKATSEGRFKDEIVPLSIPQKKGEPVVFDTDEIIRSDTTIEKLSRLRPVYIPEGTVTAGTASPISDGAAALLMMSKEKADELGLEPLASFKSYAVVGLDPAYMGLGPVYAIPKAVNKAGLSLDQIDLIEINEAFAVQYLACEKELELNRDIVNVNGGALALGHPIGCTGAKITVTLIHEMKKRNAKHGLVSLCCGGGQGVAVVLER